MQTTMPLRAVTAAALTFCFAACSASPEPAQEPIPEPAPTAAEVPFGERLLVADPDAATLHVFDLPSGDRVAEVKGITFADHPGFVALPDGRVAFIDNATKELVLMQVAGVATPAVLKRAPIPGAPAHIAVDPAATMLAVSSAANEGDATGFMTLVSLADFKPTTVPMATGEPGVALGGEPLQLFHRNDSPPAIEAYAVADLLAGRVEARSVAPIGNAPHGEVIAHRAGVMVSAAADGISVVRYEGSSLKADKTIPYAVSGFEGGRAFYARLSGDGRFLYSYLRDAGPTGTPWGEWRSDAYIVDLETLEARRIALGKGLVYRLGTCASMAAFTQYHPDGDFLHVLDASGASLAEKTVSVKVPLDRMTGAPDATGDVWASDAFRITAMSPDCAYTFVTHGGDGVVSVVDTRAGKVVRKLEVGTPLKGGGYLLPVKVGAPLVDTIGR